MTLNLISSIIVFCVSLGINFFLTPFIVLNLGNEAYAFVGITNTIVSYFAIVTIAINSLSSRFISLEFHRQNLAQANSYYSSILTINIIFCLFVAIFSLLFLLNLDYFLEIPQNLEQDIKLTFLFYFANFCLGLFNAIIGVSVFIKNKLYLISIRNAISSLILAFCIILLFLFFKPQIHYIAISALVASIFVFFSTLKINKDLDLKLEFKFSNFDFLKIKNIAKSGIFNSINALNRTLIVGTDIVICNIFLGSNLAGILAISKTAPIVLESFVAQISFIFSPKFVEIYAKNEIENLIKEVKFAMKLTAFIFISPALFFLIFGDSFYSLWLSFKPKSEIIFIYKLTIIVLIPIILIGFVFPLFSLDTTTNKLLRPALANTILGVSVVLAQICILKFSDFGVLGMGAIMAILYCFRIVIFDLMNAALNLGVKLSTFYPVFMRNLGVCLVLCAIFYLVKFEISSWFLFFFFGFVFVIFGYLFCFFLIFDFDEKRVVFDKILAKFGGKF